jgi:hypothetical protein
MSNPKAEGQPDTYAGTNWVSQSNCRPRSSNDYCGVHSSAKSLVLYPYTRKKQTTKEAPIV